jgi:general stress protein 26
MADHTREEKLQLLNEMIQGIPYAMLSTIDDTGEIHSRPMAAQQADFDGTLWFITRVKTAKCLEIQKDKRVNVSYAEPDENRFVSMSGTAEIVQDHEKLKALWTPWYKAWFVQGVDDPQLTLIRVNITHAEYWDATRSVIRVSGIDEKLDLAA